MDRFVNAFWKLLLLLISLPLIKGFYDVFLAPGTGYLVIAGADANALAIWTAVPWVFPIGCVVGIIIDLSKKDEEQPKRINFPK